MERIGINPDALNADVTLNILFNVDLKSLSRLRRTNATCRMLIDSYVYFGRRYEIQDGENMTDALKFLYQVQWTSDEKREFASYIDLRSVHDIELLNFAENELLMQVDWDNVAEYATEWGLEALLGYCIEEKHVEAAFLLDMAVQVGYVEGARIIMEIEPGIAPIDAAVRRAIQRGDLNMVQMLFNMGTVNFNSRYILALVVAAQKNNLEMLRLLVRNGVTGWRALAYENAESAEAKRILLSVPAQEPQNKKIRI